MIPSDKQSAVEKALQESFGLNVYENISQLTKGLSGSLVFKIIVQGTPYLLRIIKADTRDQPADYFANMQTAALGGIAPGIIYLNIKEGISIMEFIEERPFNIAVARAKMSVLIRQLHALPKFSTRLNYLDAADGFIQRFRSMQIVSENEMEDIYKVYQQISKVYPRNDPENLVSSHNDIKRDNIIFDGRRPWLVDWEAARLNDRYMDLAACANFVVSNEEEEADFLQGYFGQKADEYQQARFFLMSQIVHLFCFSLCTMMVAAGKPIHINREHPGFAVFHEGLWRGEINLGNNDEKLKYGLVHLEEFRNKINTQRFDDSLRIVAAYKNNDTLLKMR